MREHRNRTMEMQFLAVVLVLILFGTIMIFSASWPSSSEPTYYLRQHVKWIGLGLVVMLISSFFPYQHYKKLAFPIFVFAYFLCFAVFSPLGTDENTFARRWISLGGKTLMPSDFLKIAIILVSATYFSRHKYIKSFKKATLPVLLTLAFTILPVMLQPDLSTSFTIALTVMVMFYVAGMNKYHVVPIIGMSAFGLYVLIKTDPMRMSRLMAFQDPLKDYFGKGWQLSHSLFAISSGGAFGVGLGLSRQKYILSQPHNDFIFAIIAEELGFVGCITLILLFVYLTMMGLKISANTEDNFARFLALGITSLIGIQALINIFTTLGLMPPTGIALPFISYGGTSLLSFMFLIGIMLNIAKQESALMKRGKK